MVLVIGVAEEREGRCQREQRGVQRANPEGLAHLLSTFWLGQAAGTLAKERGVARHARVAIHATFLERDPVWAQVALLEHEDTQPLVPGDRDCHAMRRASVAE